MRIPGFAAESSVGPAMGTYLGKAVYSWTNRSFVPSITSIGPQQLSVSGTIGSDCFGSVEKCIIDHCSDLDDRGQRQKCVNACRRPAVCSPCACTCGPDCTRTCQRECHKSILTSSGGFVDVTCTEPCTL